MASRRKKDERQSARSTRSTGSGKDDRPDQRFRRAAELADAGTERCVAGRTAEGEEHLRKAATLLRALIEEEPTNGAYRMELGSLLYNLGEWRIHTDPFGSREALDEAYQVYEGLSPDRVGTRVTRLADVLMRRARAHAAVGHVVSALTDADTAVVHRLELGTLDPAARKLDTARVLSVHAIIVAGYGDPDIAVAAADQSARIYLRESAVANNGPAADMHLERFVQALKVARSIHEAYGRSDLAHQACSVGRTAGLPIESIIGRGELETYGPPFAEALRQAGADHVLLDALTAPPEECAIVTSGQRSGPGIAPVHGLSLAALVERTIDDRPQLGLRIGLEAHLILAAASRAQSTAMRYQFHEVGPGWADLLRRCSGALAERAPAMALDACHWMAGVVDQMMPHAMTGDAACRASAIRCMTWHRDLLASVGRPDEAADVHTALDRLGVL